MLTRSQHLEFEEESTGEPIQGCSVWWHLRLEALARYLMDRLAEEGDDEDNGPTSPQA
jgi:hypothetical protein